MKLSRLLGGIHPDECKFAADEPIIKQQICVDDLFTIPFVQHIGAAATPLVSVGDNVLRGQLLAKAKGEISSNVHSSVTGVVTSLGDVLHASYGTVSGCIIKATDTSDDYVKLDDFENIIDYAKAGGLVGLGGAGFPTSVKLKQIGIDAIIINATECEPYLTTDHSLIMQNHLKILEIAKIIKSEFKADIIVIAIEDNKENAANLLKRDAERFDVIVTVVPTKYPQGGEKQLINTVLGRVVPKGKLPSDVGVLVQNVATVFALYEAVFNKKPLIDRNVTITGDIDKSYNILCRIGTPIKNIFDQLSIDYSKFKKIIFGGPMTGTAIYSELTPLVKTTGGVLLLNNVTSKDIKPCISCGRCVSVCVMHLAPYELERFIKKDNYEKMIKADIMSCIECGSCSYVCPSNRLISQSIKIGKKKVTAFIKKSKS